MKTTPVRTCEVCGASIESRQAKTCSPECKRIRKRSYDRARYPQIREAKANYDSMYRIENQARRRSAAREYYWANREQKRAYDARYREQNRELLLERKSTWQREAASDPEFRARRIEYSARRRARRRGQGDYRVTERDKRRLLHRYRNRCAYCRCRFSELAPLEWDHVVPLSRGGAHSIGNLLPACRACNRSKSSRLLAEWSHPGIWTAVIRDGYGLDHERILRSVR